MSIEEEWEQEMLDSGVARYYKGIERSKQIKRDGKTYNVSTESNNSYGISMIRYYVKDVSDLIKHQVAMRKGKAGRTPLAWEYLDALDSEEAAYITTKCILDSISKAVPVSTLAVRIGTKIEDNERFSSFEDRQRKYLKGVKKSMKAAKINNYHRKRKFMIHAMEWKDGQKVWKSWSTRDKLHLGSACIDIFLQATSDYDDNGKRIPGTGIIDKYSQSKGSNGHTTYLICGTVKAYEWIRANTEFCQYLTPDFMPTLEEPLPWSNPWNGGYHVKQVRNRKPLVKMQQDIYLKKMHENRFSMPKFFRAINVLQETKWEVNKAVLEIAKEEFNRDDGIGMPRSVPYVFPENPLGEYYKDPDASDLTDIQKVYYKDYKNSYRIIRELEQTRVSKAMQVSRTLAMANKMSTKEKFHYVYTADSRSRIYAAGSTLSPQGTDLSKALLRFKEGTPLGDNGYKHLCIHAVGLYDVGRVSLKDRHAWLEEHIDDIIQTGTNPRLNRAFWGVADKQWQFLAACQEISMACTLSNEDKAEFISHIPVALDGTCNGLQHYSAMLRDPIGSKSVNLLNHEVPQDIYTDTSNKVTEYLEYGLKYNKIFDGKDWMNGSVTDMALYRGLLQFKVDRKLTKKPTMVIPYGGMKMACRDHCQLWYVEELEKRVTADPLYKSPLKNIVIKAYDGRIIDPEKHATKLLHHLVWLSLDEVVIAARKAMKFIRDITRKVVNQSRNGIPIQWDTPTGFRVYQDVKSQKDSQIRTHLEGVIKLTLKRDSEKLDKYRMASSIAPNFVHSLDSSHLQDTICRAKDYLIDNFGVVHDSFSCPAGQIDMLHIAIRESFVSIHNGNVLIDFYNTQVRKFPHLCKDFPNPNDVEQGNFDLTEVYSSTFFFI